MSTPAPARGQVSVTGVLLALVFLTVASVGFTGNPFWLLTAGTKWVAAGALAVIGLGLVASTLPKAGRRQP
ncbi:MAG: hypothetical protein ABJA16_14665 [Nakamurella sp.]